MIVTLIRRASREGFLFLIMLQAFQLGAYEIQHGINEQKNNIDFISYQIHLEPNLKDKSIKGRVHIQFKVLVPELRTLSLNAINKSIHSVSGEGVISHQNVDDKLSINFTEAVLKKGQFYTVTIEYLATPDKGVTFSQDHLFTHYNTEQWLVSHFGIGDRAQIEIWLTLPAKMKAVANGNLIDIITSGELAIHHWKESRQRPLFTFGFAAGYFKEKVFSFDDINFHYLYLKASDDEIQLMFADVKNIYKFFKAKSGKALQQSRYTYVVTENNAMQEASGFSLVGRNFVRQVLDEPRESWLITHELAHEWWGNAISAESWSDFWLNEGLVQFLVAAFKAKQYGQDEYDREMVLFKESILRQLKKSTDLKPVSPQKSISFKDFKKYYRGIAYSKGAYIFHMLKIELGNEVFWQGLKRYSQDNWESTVTSQKLQHAFETVSGRKLDKFFNTWVYNSQQLALTAQISYQKGSLAIHFKQTQEMPVDFHFWIAVDVEESRRFHKVNMTGSQKRVELTLEAVPKGLWLDFYQYLPLQIDVIGVSEYIGDNVFRQMPTITRYWALKDLIESDSCVNEPERIKKLLLK